MTKERIEIIRQALIPFVKKELLEINNEGLGKSDAEEFEKDLNEVLDLSVKALDCVSLGVYKQVVWERDAAIEQLKELGYSFGEKIRTSDDCVSREAVLETIEDCNKSGLTGIFCSYNDGERFKEYIKKLPPVTPTFPKGATNGDMIKAMFPKIEIYTDVINEIVDVEICEDSSELRCSIDWWNAPYKRGNENGNN